MSTSAHPSLSIVIRITSYNVCYTKLLRVVIDLVCYRRRGHNEADEPSGTQPLMYAKIKGQKTTRTLYADQLVAEGVITAEQSNEMEKEYRRALENGA